MCSTNAGRSAPCATASRSTSPCGQNTNAVGCVAQASRCRSASSNTGCASSRRLADDARAPRRSRSAARSASLVSLNRRTFSIAITAWSAKVCSSVDLLCRRTGRPRRAQTRSRRSPRRRCSSGTARHAAVASRLRSVAHARWYAPDRPATSATATDARVEDRACRDRCRGRAARGNAAPHRRSASALNAVSATRCSRSPSISAGTPPTGRRAGARALGDRVEHRLHVGRRAADDAQDLGRRGLLLERLLGLVEQAHVLDRDHRLVGEGLQQRDLACARTARARGARRRSRRSAPFRAASAPTASRGSPTAARVSPSGRTRRPIGDIGNVRSTRAVEQRARRDDASRSSGIGIVRANASARAGDAAGDAPSCSSSPSTRKCDRARSAAEQAQRSSRRSRRTPAARRSASSLMTRRISAVAVCCSSASLVSLNRRTFSIAMTAWSAKVLSRACSRSLKPPSSGRDNAIEPMPRPP